MHDKRNAIRIPMIKSGCMKSEFDSTYPNALKGIIEKDEFEQSIDKMNETIPSQASRIIINLLFFLSIITGTFLFIFSVLIRNEFSSTEVHMMVVSGAGLWFIAICIISIADLQCTVRMRLATLEQSVKYVRRLPTPSIWKLNISKNYYKYKGLYGPIQGLYELVIEVKYRNPQQNDILPPSHQTNLINEEFAVKVQ